MSFLDRAPSERPRNRMRRINISAYHILFALVVMVTVWAFDARRRRDPLFPSKVSAVALATAGTLLWSGFNDMAFDRVEEMHKDLLRRVDDAKSNQGVGSSVNTRALEGPLVMKATLLSMMGRIRDSILLYEEEILPLMERIYGESSGPAVKALKELAHLCTDVGDYDRALHYLHQRIRVVESSPFFDTGWQAELTMETRDEIEVVNVCIESVKDQARYISLVTDLARDVRFADLPHDYKERPYLRYDSIIVFLVLAQAARWYRRKPTKRRAAFGGGAFLLALQLPLFWRGEFTSQLARYNGTVAFLTVFWPPSAMEHLEAARLEILENPDDCRDAVTGMAMQTFHSAMNILLLKKKYGKAKKLARVLPEILEANVVSTPLDERLMNSSIERVLEIIERAEEEKRRKRKETQEYELRLPPDAVPMKVPVKLQIPTTEKSETRNVTSARIGDL